MTAALLPDLHPLQEVEACTVAIREALAVLPEGPLPAGGTSDVGALLRAVTAATSQLDELALRLCRLAEAEDEASKVAMSGTDAWLAALIGTKRTAMAGGLWLARMLEERYPSVRVAMARGDLAERQARVIVRAAERMPAGVQESDRQAAVDAIVERAVDQRLDPGRLRRVARRMLAKVAPELADVHEKDLLEGEETRARSETWFQMSDNGDGTWSGRFVVPDLHAHLLRTLLEHLSSPRRLSRNAAGQSVVDSTLDTGRSRSEHQGDAFTELIEHLPTDGLANHGRVGATVMVHLDHQHLLDGLASAGLDCGTDISAGEARRLACGAGIIPAVFGGAPVPLDVGREARLHTKAQRAALSALYDECAAEGCRRPFAWTEIHHPHAWADGGRTDLHNAIPLCGWHHRRAHDPTYLVQQLATREIRFRRRSAARDHWSGAAQHRDHKSDPRPDLRSRHPG